MITVKSRISPLITLTILLASLGVFLLTMRAAREILSPLILALVIAITARPIIYWFTNRGLPGWMAYFLAILAVILTILVIVWLISSSIQDFRQSLPTYMHRIEEIEGEAGKILDKFGVDIDDLIENDRIIAPDRAMELAAELPADLHQAFRTGD